jgi:hypothetical protein
MEQRLRYVCAQIADAEDERARLGAGMVHRQTLRDALRKDHRRVERTLRACVARAAREIAAHAAPECSWVGIVQARVYAALTALSKGRGSRA